MKLERNFAVDSNGSYMETTYLNLEGDENPSESFTFDSDSDNRITTDYFDTQSALLGFVFLVRTKCVDHLLIPDGKLSYINEMKSSVHCLITKVTHNGHECLEILFDDQSTTPFVLNVSLGLCSSPLASRSAPFKLEAWTRGGKVDEWPASQRVGRQLPNLRPWK